MMSFSVEMLGDWNRGRGCDTGGLFPRDSYTPFPIPCQ